MRLGRGQVGRRGRRRIPTDQSIDVDAAATVADATGALGADQSFAQGGRQREREQRIRRGDRRRRRNRREHRRGRIPRFGEKSHHGTRTGNRRFQFSNICFTLRFPNLKWYLNTSYIFITVLLALEVNRFFQFTKSLVNQL